MDSEPLRHHPDDIVDFAAKSAELDVLLPLLEPENLKTYLQSLTVKS